MDQVNMMKERIDSVQELVDQNFATHNQVKQLYYRGNNYTWTWNIGPKQKATHNNNNYFDFGSRFEYFNKNNDKNNLPSV